MSLISLEQAKDYLRVTDAADDVQIQMMIDACENEALRFMNRSQFGSLSASDDGFSSETENMPDSVRLGILLMIGAAYDSVSPSDYEQLISVSEHYFMPYRICNGV